MEAYKIIMYYFQIFFKFLIVILTRVISSRCFHINLSPVPKFYQFL